MNGIHAASILTAVWIAQGAGLFKEEPGFVGILLAGKTILKNDTGKIAAYGMSRIAGLME